MSLPRELRQLWRLASLGPRRRWQALVVLAVVVSVVEAATGGLVYALLASLTGAGGVELPLVGRVEVDRAGAPLAVALFFLVRGLLVLGVVRLQHRTGHETGATISTHLLDTYLREPYDQLVGRDTAGRVKNVYQAVPEVVVYALIPSVVLLSEGLVALGLGLVVLAAAPTLALGAVVYLGVVLLLVQRVVSPRLTQLGGTSQQQAASSLKTLDEAFSGIREVRLLALRPAMVARFAEQRHGFAAAHGTRASYVEVPRVVLESAVGLLVLGILVLSAGEPGQLTQVLPTLGLAGYAVARVMPSVNRIAAARNNLRFGLPAVQEVCDELDRTVTDDLPGDAPPLPLTRDLRAEGVRFAYPDGTVVLRGIDLAVPSGSWLGVVGTTGSGKSTLVDVLLGLLHPADGAVRADGVDVATASHRWWRTTALVPQTVHLFDTTIADNITLGEAHYDADTLARAVADAALEDFVASLPEGLATRVGEGGSQLSGGQRQRVALARALYRDPAMLILDEGTAALDHETERQVLSGLRQRRAGMTLVVVGHRVSSIRTCDKVVLLDHGEVAAHGTYEQLASDHPAFSALLS